MDTTARESNVRILYYTVHGWALGTRNRRDGMM